MSEVFLFYNGPFSQWYQSKFQDINPDEKESVKQFYNCEQYMMYNKALLFHDQESADAIMNTDNPKTIKQLGRKVKNFNEERWLIYRERIVQRGNYLKFTQNNNLKLLLLETGNKIIAEASPYDKIWGIGLSVNSPDATNVKKWKGQNLLGVALMMVRNAIVANEIK